MVAELFNSSLEFGSLFNQMTLNFTGSITITLIIVLLFLLVIGLLFRIPVMLVLIVLLPLIMVFAEFDYTGGFYTILSIIAIILGFILAKTMFSYR